MLCPRDHVCANVFKIGVDKDDNDNKFDYYTYRCTPMLSLSSLT